MFFKVLKREYTDNYGIKHFLLLRAIKWYLKAPNYRVVTLLRYYSLIRNNVLKRIISNKLSIKYGVEVGTNPQIGKQLHIEHFQNIVIGNDVIIRDNVKIYQGVTLGEKNKGYPVVENNVTIFPGAKVIGHINIGEGAVIGANSVVLDDVPEKSVVAGVPAVVVSKNR